MFNLNDVVYDDLTNSIVKIIGMRSITREPHDKVTFLYSTIYIVDSSHLDGERYPWELSKKKKEELT